MHESGIGRRPEWHRRARCWMGMGRQRGRLWWLYHLEFRCIGCISESSIDVQKDIANNIVVDHQDPNLPLAIPLICPVLPCTSIPLNIPLQHSPTPQYDPSLCQRLPSPSCHCHCHPIHRCHHCHCHGQVCFDMPL